MKPLLVADLFCGAGGSSTGAEKAVKALGRKMTLVCVNHWPVAIETHKLNHPTARHYIEDIAVADPERIVPEGRLDLLMASPECRFYSRARGGKPTHDQGRMNPWAVHRWLTSLDIRTVLIENVPEFIHWGPVDAEGRPIAKAKGTFFQAWLHSIWDLGYKAEWRYLNAADYGDATTRTRFFLQARKDGKPIIWPTPTHSETGESDMIEHLPKWRSAAEIIEWDNPGRSLIDDPKYKKRPLSENMRRRIARGLEKFGGALAPFYIELLGLDFDCFIPPVKNHDFDYVKLSDKTLQRIAKGSEAVADKYVFPFILGKQTNPSIRSVDSPIPTLTTEGAISLIQPFVIGQNGTNPAYRDVESPVPTVSTPRSVKKPIPTVVSDGAISVTTPLMVKYYGTGVCHSTKEPIPTVTTKDRIGIATAEVADKYVFPFILGKQTNPSIRSVDSPIPTLTTEGAISLIQPFVIGQNGTNPAYRDVESPVPTVSTPRSVKKPIPTVVSDGAISVTTPLMVKYYGTGVCHSTKEPIPTVTTKDRIGIATAEAKPFVVQNRIRPDVDRVYDIEEPLKTVTGHGAGSLVNPLLVETKMDPRRLVEINGEVYKLDLRFRMLSNLELARAMGFTDSESTYEFVGNSSQVTKQIGNAVPVNLAAALVKAVLG